MDATGGKPENIDEYIAAFPEATRERLEQMRATIRAAAPAAREVMSYRMPTFKAGKLAVHFAAYTNHIGFYPTPAGIHPFAEELSAYKQGKGSVQFPLDKPLPLDLIARMVKFRLVDAPGSTAKS